MDSNVWYELAIVPQLMPEELSARTPPTVQATDEAGSGPSLR